MNECTNGREAACWFAEGDVTECRCECGGEHHGMGIIKEAKDYDEALEIYRKRLKDAGQPPRQ